MYSQAQINAAIDVEAFQWAQFFNVTDPDQIEERRQVMRANVSVGFIDPLIEFLPPPTRSSQELAMTETNLSVLIDAYGRLKAQQADLAKEEKRLKEALGDLPPGPYEGELFRLTVTQSERETLDMEAVREKLTPQFMRAHTNVTEVRTLRVSARKGE